MEDQQSDFFLDEPVAPITSDPVYALMSKEDDEFDFDQTPPELAQREQINFKRSWDAQLSAPESIASSSASSMNYMVRRTVKRLSVMLETGQITWAEAFKTLSKLGVEEEEAAELLSE